MLLTRGIFLSYFLCSIIMGYYAVTTTDLPVPFDYNNLISTDDLYSPAGYLFIGILFFYLGYGRSISSSVQAAIKEEKNLISNKVILLAKFAQVLILFFFIGNIYLSLVDVDLSNLGDKYLSDKSSNPFLFIQAVIPLCFLRGGWKVFSIFICLLLAFVYGFVDASRAAVIPLAGLLINSLARKRKSTFFYLLAIVFLIGLSFYARGVPDRLEMNFFVFLGEFLTFFSDIAKSVVSYVFAFSFLQFVYVYKENSGFFELSDLIYSLTPIPTIFWSSPPAVYQWRVDAFRPMGALSEVLRVSSSFFFGFLFLFGRLSKSIDCIKNPLLNILSMPIFLVILVCLFQYNMRTVMWLIVFILAVIFVDKILEKRQI